MYAAVGLRVPEMGRVPWNPRGIKNQRTGWFREHLQEKVVSTEYQGWVSTEYQGWVSTESLGWVSWVRGSV